VNMRWLLVFLFWCTQCFSRDSPKSYFTATKNIGCGQGDLGASGSTGLEDCEYFCFVDPRCKWANYALENGQCEWGSGPCELNSATNIDAAVRSKPNSENGFFWTNGAMRDNVLMTKTTTFQDAFQWCHNAFNCTTFSFTSDSHRPADNDTLLFYFLNGNQIVDPDGLSNSWAYYKNSTEVPYCDAIVSPLFAPAGVNGRVEISWTHCDSGSDIVVQIASPDGKVISSQKLSSGNSMEFTTPPNGKVGEVYTLSILSKPSLVMHFPIEYASNVCESDGIWPAQKAPASSSILCWNVNSTYATGKATRKCTDSGWAPPDFSQCSNGGWTETELTFLNSNLETFYPSDSHKAQWPWYASFLFYWPGNKIYGISQGKISGDCTSGGTEDVPGNMAGPQWRRMQIWWENGPPGQDHCENYNISFLTSIMEDSQHGGTTYVNNWFTLINTNGDWSVEYNETTRLRVQMDSLPFRDFVLPRMVLTDTVEDTCVQSLQKKCGNLFGQEAACLECALKNRASLANECKKDHNQEDDIKFWCECKDINDCGGTPPVSN